MTTRERLHEHIDALPDELLPRAASALADVRPEAEPDVEARRRQRFREALHRFAGSATEEEHPEWATPELIQQWVTELRADNQPPAGHLDRDAS